MGQHGYFYVSYYDSRFGRGPIPWRYISMRSRRATMPASTNTTRWDEVNSTGSRLHGVVRERLHRPGDRFTERGRLLLHVPGREL